MDPIKNLFRAIGQPVLLQIKTLDSWWASVQIEGPGT